MPVCPDVHLSDLTMPDGTFSFRDMRADLLPLSVDPIRNHYIVALTFDSVGIIEIVLTYVKLPRTCFHTLSFIGD